MIDFNGTKIEKDKLIVNAKVESEIINNVDIYEKVHLKNIKVYTPDNYPDSSKYLIDADNEDSYNGDSTSGDLGTPNQVLTSKNYKVKYGQSILLGNINVIGGHQENIHFTDELIVSKREGTGNEFGCSPKDIYKETISIDLPSNFKSIIPTIVTKDNKEYLVFKISAPAQGVQVFLRVRGVYDLGSYYPIKANAEGYLLDYEISISNGDFSNVSIDYTNTNGDAVFGLLLSTFDILEGYEDGDEIDYTEKEYEHTFKDLRLRNTSQTAMDFTKEILIVEANVEGSPDITTPCGKDLTKEIFVVYDKKIPYKQAMGYLKSIGGCEPSKEFMDFILRLKSLELSVEACNYQQAAYIWKWFTNNATDPCGVKIKSNCNCHG